MKELEKEDQEAEFQPDEFFAKPDVKQPVTVLSDGVSEEYIRYKDIRPELQKLFTEHIERIVKLSIRGYKHYAENRTSLVVDGDKSPKDDYLNKLEFAVLTLPKIAGIAELVGATFSVSQTLGLICAIDLERTPAILAVAGAATLDKAKEIADAARAEAIKTATPAECLREEVRTKRETEFRAREKARARERGAAKIGPSGDLTAELARLNTDLGLHTRGEEQKKKLTASRAPAHA